MPPRQALLVGAAVLAAFAVEAAAEESRKASTTPREGIEALEAQLSRAVDRVSLPHAAQLLGRIEAARGYRLPGYGVVFVLAPRTLPGGEGHVYVLRGAPKHRRVRVETRGTGEREETVFTDDVETFERQVLVLQHETEAARRAAEEEMEQLVQDVRVRVAPPTAVHVEVREEPLAPPVAPDAPSAPVPTVAPVPPVPPAPPPWKFWFGSGALRENRTPEAVVAEVRAALVDALAGQVRLAGLAGDERVTVTVDFVPGGVFAVQARPERTLVLSARVRDVDARARGAITAEELRKRVEVTEY